MGLLRNSKIPGIFCMLYTKAFHLLKRGGDSCGRKSEAQGYRAEYKDNQELPLATHP